MFFQGLDDMQAAHFNALLVPESPLRADRGCMESIVARAAFSVPSVSGKLSRQKARDVSDEPTACFFVFQRAIRWVRRCGELVQEIERGCTLLACAEQQMLRVPIVTARHPVAFPAVHRVQEGGSF
jgi:hypothetical protein